MQKTVAILDLCADTLGLPQRSKAVLLPSVPKWPF